MYSLNLGIFPSIPVSLNCVVGFWVAFYLVGRPVQALAAQAGKEKNLLPGSGIDQPVNEGPLANSTSAYLIACCPQDLYRSISISF
jgi:hypothetical protein